MNDLSTLERLVSTVGIPGLLLFILVRWMISSLNGKLQSLVDAMNGLAEEISALREIILHDRR